MKRKIDLVAQELRRLADKAGGLLLPEKVVEAARPTNSPLHSRFEWDDSEAAQAYRIWQARQLIRVCIEILPNMNAPTEVFVSLSSDRREKGGYRLVQKVCSHKEMREQMLVDAIAELQLFQAKYALLNELVEVFRQANKVHLKHGRRRESALATA